MSHNEHMSIPTPEALAELLKTVNVLEVAKESGISSRTVYRYRWNKSTPGLVALAKLLPAIAKVQKRAKEAA